MNFVSHCTFSRAFNSSRLQAFGRDPCQSHLDGDLEEVVEAFRLAFGLLPVFAPGVGAVSSDEDRRSARQRSVRCVMTVKALSVRVRIFAHRLRSGESVDCEEMRGGAHLFHSFSQVLFVRRVLDDRDDQRIKVAQRLAGTMVSACHQLPS